MYKEKKISSGNKLHVYQSLEEKSSDNIPEQRIPIGDFLFFWQFNLCEFLLIVNTLPSKALLLGTFLFQAVPDEFLGG